MIGKTMKTELRAFISGLLLLFCQSALALKERHLIIIRHAEATSDLVGQYNTNPKHPHYKPASLTPKGFEQAKQISELLLTYGFDNRTIAAVYVSPLPRTQETAQVIAQMGIFSAEKIHVDSRLLDIQAGDREGLVQPPLIRETWHIDPKEAKSYRGEANDDVRERVLAIYDEAEKKYPQGHILFITDGIPAMELINTMTKTQVKLETAQAYMLPLQKRQAFS